MALIRGSIQIRINESRLLGRKCWSLSFLNSPVTTFFETPWQAVTINRPIIGFPGVQQNTSHQPLEFKSGGVFLLV